MNDVQVLAHQLRDYLTQAQQMGWDASPSAAVKYGDDNSFEVEILEEVNGIIWGRVHGRGLYARTVVIPLTGYPVCEHKSNPDLVPYKCYCRD